MNQNRLTGWKAIARFMGRETRTVQLWERERGLPIHRLPGHPSQSVYAHPHELNGWLSGSQHIAKVDPKAATARAPGLLVLPFQFHGTGDHVDASVGDTLAHELLHRLTVAPPSRVRVLSWTTACSYRASDKRADEIASTSDIRYLVEGMVQERGSHWCIDIRLVDAVNDRVEFADRFTAGATEVFALQSIIAEAVSGQLAMHIGGGLVEPFWNEPVSPQAFLAYVVAARAATRPNTRDLRAALARAEEACNLDKGFIPAHLLRASLQIQLARNAGGSLAHDGAKNLAMRWISMSPRLATTKALDAMLATTVDHEWDRAERRYSEITSALPANLDARVGSAINHAMRRRFPDAQTAIDSAVSIERTPQILQAQAYLHIWKGEYETAAALQDEILLNPDFQYPTIVMQAMVVGMLLRDDVRMRALLGLIEPEMADSYRNFLAVCTAASTRDDVALRAAHKRLAAAAECRDGLWYHVALVDGFVGNAKDAADNLGRAIDLRETGIRNAAVAPCFASVRDDPRFDAQLRRLKLC